MATTKRRGRRGDGAVFQRKEDGLWGGSFTVAFDENGKRKRRTVWRRTKTEAVKELTLMRADAHRGILVDPKRMTIAAFLRSWLEDDVEPRLKLSTYISYEKVVRLHLNPRIGGFQISAVDSDVVKRLLAHMRKDGVSPRTVELTYCVLRTAMNQAKARKLIRENPCGGVKKPTVEQKEMLVLNTDEVTRFIDAARSDRLYALYVLAIGTGLRQGELLGLTWERVDLLARTITVTQGLHENRGKLSLGPLKTKASRRLVRLPEVAVRALREHREAMKAEGHGSNLVFCDRNGGFIRKSNLLRRSFKPIVRAAGVPDIRFHDIRHTAATLMLLKNVPVKVVAERLGHASIKITLDTYAHVMPDMQEGAARAMDEVLANLA